jgi:hypothetical protein
VNSVPNVEHPGQAAAVDERRIAAAWERVSEDARHLAELYQRAGVPTRPAFVDTTGRRRDRAWFSVWFLTQYRPARRAYVETMDGRVANTAVISAVPGVAMLADGSLHLYRLVRWRPMLMVSLRRATPHAPPSRALFAMLSAQVPGRG